MNWCYWRATVISFMVEEGWMFEIGFESNTYIVESLAMNWIKHYLKKFKTPRWYWQYSSIFFGISGTSSNVLAIVTVSLFSLYEGENVGSLHHYQLNNFVSPQCNTRLSPRKYITAGIFATCELVVSKNIPLIGEYTQSECIPNNEIFSRSSPV